MAFARPNTEIEIVLTPRLDGLSPRPNHALTCVVTFGWSRARPGGQDGRDRGW